MSVPANTSFFEHVAKPPVLCVDYPSQRHFCPPGADGGLNGVGGDKPGSPPGEVAFYRSSCDDFARLTVSVLGGIGYAGIHLSPKALRAVATLCLDCAHDIEAFPSKELEP
jgi:hypothetical protein